MEWSRVSESIKYPNKVFIIQAEFALGQQHSAMGRKDACSFWPLQISNYHGCCDLQKKMLFLPTKADDVRTGLEPGVSCFPVTNTGDLFSLNRML